MEPERGPEALRRTGFTLSRVRSRDQTSVEHSWFHWLLLSKTLVLREKSCRRSCTHKVRTVDMQNTSNCSGTDDFTGTLLIINEELDAFAG